MREIPLQTQTRRMKHKKRKDKKFSFSEFLNNAKDKVDDAIDAVGDVATEKLSAFEDGLNRIMRAWQCCL